MNILITGYSGFLGTELVKQLQALGHLLTKVNSKNGDLQIKDSLKPFNSNRYDLIFHLAAWTQAGDFCLYHPGEQWIINQQINTNVLQWWQADQPQAKLISIGTSCAYAESLPLVEENYLKGEPIDSLYAYAMTKRMMQIGLLALQKQYRLQYLTVIPSTLYGPGYYREGKQMHFIFDLIRKILEAKFYGKPAVLWGDGNQKREIVYIADFVKILIELSLSRTNDLINIGSGEDYSIKEFAEKICEIVNYDPKKIQYDTSQYVGAKSKLLKIDKLQSWMNQIPFTPLHSGLQKTIEWFSKTFYQKELS